MNQVSVFQQVTNLVGGQKEFFLPVISDEKIKWEKEYQFALQVLNKPDNKNKNQLCYAGKLALQNPASLQNALINVAAIGITLNPASKLAYLVPRDGGICLDISYMGLLDIAQKSGSILWGQCKLVRENDQYQNMGLDKAPMHTYNAFGDRGVVVGGYCTVKLPSGDYLTEEMTLADIKKIEASSKAGTGPWKTWWEEMARKSIVKRAYKYWPKTDRLDTAIHYSNTEGGEGLVEEGEVLDEMIIDVDDHILSLAKKQNKTELELFDWLSKAFKREIKKFDDMKEDEKQFIARRLEGKKQ